MRARAITLQGNLGLSDGKRILAEQDKLPVKFLGKIVIVLPGTVVRGAYGILRVAFLIWFGSEWILRWRWLDDDWSGLDRFARSK